MHDETERPIHLPLEPEEQQEYNSGKKKCHTVKNILMTDETCHIDFVSGPMKARCMIRESSIWGYTFPPGSRHAGEHSQ